MLWLLVVLIVFRTAWNIVGRGRGNDLEKKYNTAKKAWKEADEAWRMARYKRILAESKEEKAKSARIVAEVEVKAAWKAREEGRGVR